MYGTPGGGRTLRERGAIPGGDLAPWKARIELALALEAVETEPGVEDAPRYFSNRSEPDRSDSARSGRSNRSESE